VKVTRLLPGTAYRFRVMVSLFFYAMRFNLLLTVVTLRARPAAGALSSISWEIISGVTFANIS